MLSGTSSSVLRLASRGRISVGLAAGVGSSVGVCVSGVLCSMEKSVLRCLGESSCMIMESRFFSTADVSGRIWVKP